MSLGGNGIKKSLFLLFGELSCVYPLPLDIGQEVYLFSRVRQFEVQFRQAQFRKSLYIKGFKVYTLENTLIFVGTHD